MTGDLLMATTSNISPLTAAAPWMDRVAAWDDTEADAAIREGLSVDLAAHLQTLFGLSNKEAAQLIGRSRSTYTRYRNQGAQLGPAEAERVVRYVRLVALAAETFGGQDTAVEWMQEPNRRLGDRTPLEMAETDPGARVVRDLLLGIQHGHVA